MTAPVEPAAHRRLPYVPALDGLRGVALIAVLLYHHGVAWAHGGFLAVSLFFTLSGYLITTLVVREHVTTGRLDLRNFWVRRIRRLAPAGLLGIGFGLLAIVIAVPAAQWGAAIADVRAALLQVVNWRYVLADAPYVDPTTVPSPLVHYWSLAVEEQFYLVLPLLAAWALRRSRRRLAVALGAITVLSFAAQVALPATDRVYFGTDTRAAELAIGGLLALAWPWLRERFPSASRWDLIGVLGLLITLGLWAVVPQSDPLLLNGGLTGVAIVSVLLLVGTLGGTALPKALAAQPLRWLGVASYGIYTVHFPVYLIMSPERTGLTDAPLFVARVGVSVAIAALSLWLLERPIRERRPLPIVRLNLTGRRFALAAVGSLALLAAATVPLAQRAVTPAVAATGLVPSDAALDPGAPTAAARPPRLVVVGDSTSAAIGEGLQRWGERTGALQVSVVSSPGCAVHVGATARYRPGFEFTPTACDRLFPTAVEEAAAVDADAIVVFLGSAQLADWRFSNDPDWVDIRDPGFAADYQRALDETLTLATSAGVPVLWADVALPQWDLASFGTLIGGEPPGTGEPVTNEPDRTRILNALTEEVVADHPGVSIVDFAAGLAGPDGTIAREDREDGIHMSVAQVEEAADRWLVAALADADARTRGVLGASEDEPSWTLAGPAP